MAYPARGLKKAVKDFFHNHPNTEFNYADLRHHLQGKFPEYLTDGQLCGAASPLKKEWPGFSATGQGFHMWNNTVQGVQPEPSTVPPLFDDEDEDDFVDEFTTIEVPETTPEFLHVGTLGNGTIVVKVVASGILYKLSPLNG